MQKTIDNAEFERQLWSEGFSKIIGLDEVGRGCLAGPVVAAGVILKRDELIPGVTDSKAVKTHPERKHLAEQIKEKAFAWDIQVCTPEEIDKHNILKASLLAMQKCIDHISVTPDYLLVDGNRFLPTMIPHQCVIKGDMRSISIGAASILAKVYRDELMYRLHEEFPWYGWNTNVGYPTRAHYSGLDKHGMTPHHRRSFKLSRRPNSR